MLTITEQFILTTLDGYVVRRKGTTVYGDILTRTDGDVEGDYEELPANIAEQEDRQQTASEEYRKRVVSLIRRRYSESKEFELQREAIQALSESGPKDSPIMEEFTKYNRYVNDCKAVARREFNINDTSYEEDKSE